MSSRGRRQGLRAALLVGAALVIAACSGDRRPHDPCAGDRCLGLDGSLDAERDAGPDGTTSSGGCLADHFDHDHDPWTPCVRIENACPMGESLHTTEGLSYCLPCEAGTYCSGGAAGPRVCATGRWDHDADPASPCAPHSHCPSNERQALPGTTTTDRQCEPCPANWIPSSIDGPVCDTWSLNGFTDEPTYTVEIMGAMFAPFDDHGDAWDLGGVASTGDWNRRFEVEDDYFASLAWIEELAEAGAYDPPEIYGDARLSVRGFPELPVVLNTYEEAPSSFVHTWAGRGWKHVPADDSLRILLSFYDSDVRTDDALSYVTIHAADIVALSAFGGTGALGVASITGSRVLWLLLRVTVEDDADSQHAPARLASADTNAWDAYTPPRPTTRTLWIRGLDFSGGEGTIMPWGSTEYWGAPLTGPNPIPVNYHARAYLGVSNVVLEYVMDRECVAPASCVLACHSAGCAQSEFALVAKGREGTRWNVLDILGGGAAVGGSELADDGSWTGIGGFLSRDLKTTTIRALYDHDAVGVRVGYGAGAHASSTGGSLILLGQDDGAVGYHSSGAARWALSFGNPDDGSDYLLPVGEYSSDLYADHWVYLRDDEESFNHNAMKQETLWRVEYDYP